MATAMYRQDEVEEELQQHSANSKAKLTDLSKSDLIQLIGYLEQEVHNRDNIITQVKTEQTKQVLYQAKYGRFGPTDPFSALQRDSDNVERDNFDHNQVKASFDNQLQQLENLIETQRRAQAKMREQKQAADERYKQVCEELSEVKHRYAQDSAQGDDLTVALTKEREKLQQDLAYEMNQTRKLEKEISKLQEMLETQSSLAQKHKKISIDLIKERRAMVSKISESEKKNRTIAQLLQKEQEDNKRCETSKLLQMEAKMEKQLMDFDIEREQLRAKLRKEEGKVKDLVAQLTDIKEAMLALQRESPPYPTTADITRPAASRSNISTPASAAATKPIGNTPVKTAPPPTALKPMSPATAARVGANKVAMSQSQPLQSSPMNLTVASSKITPSGLNQIAPKSNISVLQQTSRTAADSATPKLMINTKGDSRPIQQTAKLVSGPLLSPPPGRDSEKLPESSTQRRYLTTAFTNKTITTNVITQGKSVQATSELPLRTRLHSGDSNTIVTQAFIKSNVSNSPKTPHLAEIPRTNASVSYRPTSAPVASKSLTTSQTSIDNKPKPPPPIRNVSLTNRKSYGNEHIVAMPGTLSHSANQSTF